MGTAVQNEARSCNSSHKSVEAVIRMDRVRRSPGGRPPIADHVIRIGGAAALIPLLREHGVEPEPLLLEAGLTIQAFDHPDHVVPFSALCRALRLAADQTGLQDIGLRAGMRAELGSLGVLGYFVAHSETVGHGLQALREFLHVHDQGAAPFLAVEEGVAFLGYEVLEPGIAGAEQMSFGALAIAANILRALCGPGFALRAVSFSYRSPADSTLFRKVFDAPVRFNAERSALAFGTHWLEKPIDGADAYMRELLDARLKEDLSARREAFADRAQRVVRMLLASGRCHETDVARAFGMSRRSLSRRLETCGSSFRSVMDSARFDAACAILQSSPITIVEVAARLGYADSSTFARAFRRWSGTSPAHWRKRTADTNSRSID